MTDEGFRKYKLSGELPAVVRGEQATADISDYGLYIKVSKYGKSIFLSGAPEREARELARQLMACADEYDRRQYE